MAPIFLPKARSAAEVVELSRRLDVLERQHGIESGRTRIISLCTERPEALFTLGERPELRYPIAQEWLRDHGYETTIDYLVAMCQMVRDETGLLPHANAGALYRDELARLREVSPSQGMMIETLNPSRGSPVCVNPGVTVVPVAGSMTAWRRSRSAPSSTSSQTFRARPAPSFAIWIRHTTVVTPMKSGTCSTLSWSRSVVPAM